EPDRGIGVCSRQDTVAQTHRRSKTNGVTHSLFHIFRFFWFPHVVDIWRARHRVPRSSMEEQRAGAASRSEVVVSSAKIHFWDWNFLEALHCFSTFIQLLTNDCE